jgi:hypothetical protein
MRLSSRSNDRARALASVVLPTPGTSSSRRWPSERRQIRARRMGSSLPCKTWETLETIASKTDPNVAGEEVCAAGCRAIRVLREGLLR